MSVRESRIATAAAVSESADGVVDVRWLVGVDDRAESLVRAICFPSEQAMSAVRATAMEVCLPQRRAPLEFGTKPVRCLCKSLMKRTEARNAA